MRITRRVLIVLILECILLAMIPSDALANINISNDTNYTIKGKTINANVLVTNEYEYAIFPNGRVYVSQVAYGGYSHANYNVTDIVPDGDVYAPFTGTIRYKDNTWGYVVLESNNMVHYADGSLDYMCVGFMHDNNIDDLWVTKEIQQGEPFYQKGTKSPDNNVTGPHVHVVVMRGSFDNYSYYYSSSGNVYIYDAFFLTESTNIAQSGYNSSLWKYLTPDMFATSGTCGDNLSWELVDSTLVITGSGAMDDYGIYGSPWYYHRNNITSVQLPSGLTKIGAHAFQDFVITNINIPQSVTEIGEAAFERCYNLSTVTLPDNLKIIGSWVFRLSGITQIDIPYTLEFLGTHAFAETAITEITLPAGLTEIDGNPFNGLTGLTIKGYADTAAQTFANNNRFTFVLLNPVAVTGVSMIGGNQLTIAEYDQYQLTALISPANATYKNIIWSSSNPNFAEVDQNGLVTGKEPGSIATITAVSESNPDVWASVTVRVTYHTHISEWVTVQAPTYQTEGLRECRCTLCGNLLDEEVLPRLHIALQEGSTWPGDANNRTGYPTGNLQQGKGFGLRGVVIASENLVKVTGYVYSANGENALPPVVEELNAPSLDIEHSKINNELIFSNLGNGTYRYTVVAQTVSGYTETVIDSLFSVGSAAVFTPANLPASFYAYVRHQSKQLYMTNLLDNIAGKAYTGGSNQVWRFERQSSGAYAIFSELNGACVDVEGYSTSNGANVYAYTGGFNNTTNQLFYIYYMYDAYYLCPAHVNGASMVDMSLATNDFAIWTRGDNWEPQEFDIIQVKSIVQFNANGGSGAPSPIRRGYNESVMLPSRQPARLGYEFVGWAETPDADSAAYLPGNQYAEKGDAVLYALWSPVTIVRLPSGLTTLEEEAFANTQVVSVICPDGMTSIGPRAFANCASLKQIYIPESVVTIDDTAFEGCTQTIEIWGVMDSNATQFVDGHSGFRFVEAD